MQSPGLTSRFFLIGLLLSMVVALVAWGFRTAPEAARQQLLATPETHQQKHSEMAHHHTRTHRRTVRPIRVEPPRFPACQEVREDHWRERCAEQKLREQVQRHLEYPALLLGEATGTVVVRFSVDRHGRTGPPRVVRSPHPDLGRAGREAVRDVLKKYPVWEPGRRNGHPVKMQHTVPVRFYLQ
ncbi:TonB family protein [Lewinella marina]|uniref:TonB C-terminal domain-containing protein n=1 Tax=Neolewinella marina TaxID=438751 RepID=A0A2G0CE99_9BACT|nr:energy transducer TonB [Neolewinella marina]NJB87389.1 TonB family protein [Neolewinella marina]PHK98299.1 hypothetical protein CGL56_11395 [Neolewinella marina]